MKSKAGSLNKLTKLITSTQTNKDGEKTQIINMQEET